MKEELHPIVERQLAEILDAHPLTPEFDHTDPAEERYALCTGFIKQILDSLSTDEGFMFLEENGIREHGVRKYELEKSSGIYTLGYKYTKDEDNSLSRETLTLTKDYREKLTLDKFFQPGATPPHSEFYFPSHKVNANILYSNDAPAFERITYSGARAALEAERIVHGFINSI